MILPIDEIQPVAEQYGKFHADAYVFVHQALGTTAQKAKKLGSPVLHVGGRDVIEACIELANERFGPMSYAVLEEWGISQSKHIGEIIYHLIEIDILSKRPGDRIEDFYNYRHFRELLEDAMYDPPLDPWAD